MDGRSRVDGKFIVGAVRQSGQALCFVTLGAMRTPLITWAFMLNLLWVAGCNQAWNDPYPHDALASRTLYTAFTDRPKHLDPAVSYSEDEITFTAQIYEPPLQYHYLKRPYVLTPLTLVSLPEPEYYDTQGKRLDVDAPIARIAESVYELRVKPGIQFAPHPAFAVTADGQPRYLGKNVAEGRYQVGDFPEKGSRELVADDYLYQIKRLAHPALHSPIYGMMAEKIVGLKALGDRLQVALDQQPKGAWLNLSEFPLAGVEKLDRYTLRIHVHGKYPQFLYWLAMPFFAPMPMEAERFFAQPGMAEKNLTLDWWPVGTGPFYMKENDPNRQMVLARNPLFHGESYPCEGEESDRPEGLLADCGQALPMLEQIVFTREKESIPYWNKFLQGYYDASGISSDSFDQAVKIGAAGEIGLTDEMMTKGIRLLTAVKSSSFYMGFNMQDPVVGGGSERSKKLRQAISIAIDQEEYISIFQNGRGIPAQGPIPPGIFGYEQGEPGINRVVYEWRDDLPVRKSIEFAKQLMREAGYPSGRDVKTGEPLVLNLDTTGGGAGEKARLDWMIRQFAKIDIQLVLRPTDFNRFQDKLRKGNVQLYQMGWNADYPDPENFFFLLNGKEGKVQTGGENASNYQNPEFDRLFDQMKYMDNTPARLALIRQMNRIVQEDAPWVFGLHPKSYSLSHRWLKNRKPNDVAHNTLKYQKIQVEDREQARREWNQPVLFPLFALLVGCLGLVLPVFWLYRRHEKQVIAE